MKICVTGHRPDKLFGYDLNDKRWIKLKDIFKQILVEAKCTEAISGMALGTDMVFALAVLELKDEGYQIKLHCAIPFRGQSNRWARESRFLYDSILELADKVTLVSDDEYRPWLMQKRNEFMVDEADKVIAVWNGSSGGTKNCIDYAIKSGKEIIRIRAT